MLIYNAQKKLVGIDESDLHALGFTTLADLTSDTQDFSDLFVKKPGFIHNFKHVNWIDFVACIDIPENAKVIIHANSKDFECTLKIDTIYLTDEPSSKAFIITLNNLYNLNTDGSDPISIETVKTSFSRSIEKSLSEETQKQTVNDTLDIKPLESASITSKPLDLEFHDEFINTLEDDLKINIEEHPEEIEIEKVKEIEVAETEMQEVKKEIEIKEEPEQEQEVLQEEKIIKTTQLAIYDNGYIYDPHVASSELGLPVELIEEFIGDFIAQAKEFEEDVYGSFNDHDHNTLQILSHKLKGVAANLRIEDALESLTIINTSEDNADIEKNIDIFYKIISKLSGEKTIPVELSSTLQDKVQNKPINEEDTLELVDFEDKIELDFKIDDEVHYKEDTKTNTIEQPQLEDKIELDFKVDDEVHYKKDTKTNTIEQPQLEDKIELDFKVDDEISSEMNQEKVKPSEIENDLELELKLDDQTPQIENTLELNFKEEIEELEENLIKDTTPNTITMPLLDDDLFKAQLDVKEIKKPLYDKDAVALEIGIDKDSFDELFEDYTIEAESLITAIDKAIEVENINLLQHQTMKLKSMSDNMRIQSFNQELQDLMQTNNMKQAEDISNKIKQTLIQISERKE